MRLLWISSLLVCSWICTCSDKYDGDVKYWDNVAQKRLNQKLGHNGKHAKNVILFIVNGMGSSLLTLSRRHKPTEKADIFEPLFMETFDYSGIVRTASYDKHATDSLAASAAMATGNKAPFGFSQMNPVVVLISSNKNCTLEHLDTRESNFRLSASKGKQIGIVTDLRLTEGSAAGAYAKQASYIHEDFDHRRCSNIERTIAKQLINIENLKVAIGGGANRLFPFHIKYNISGKVVKGNRDGSTDVIQEWLKMGNRTFISSADELFDYTYNDSEQVLAVIAPDRLEYMTDRKRPKMAKLVSKAIEILQNDNDNGFFLQVSGGLADKYSRENHVDQAVRAIQELDEAVKMARQMTSKNDTLIIVTGDYSHAMSLVGYVPSDNVMFDKSSNNTPGVLFATGPSQTSFGYSLSDYDEKLFQSPVAYKTRDAYRGVEDVPLFADGPGSWMFSGSMENTEIGYLIAHISCLNKSLKDCDKWNKQQAKVQSERKQKNQTNSSVTPDEEESNLSATPGEGDGHLNKLTSAEEDNELINTLGLSTVAFGSLFLFPLLVALILVLCLIYKHTQSNKKTSSEDEIVKFTQIKSDTNIPKITPSPKSSSAEIGNNNKNTASASQSGSTESALSIYTKETFTNNNNCGQPVPLTIPSSHSASRRNANSRKTIAMSRPSVTTPWWNVSLHSEGSAKESQRNLKNAK